MEGKYPMMQIKFLLLLRCLVISSSPSPSSNTCTTSPDSTYQGLYIDCHGKGLTKIPANFPENATSIDLSSNQIEVVTNYSFSSVDNLQFLNLAYNQISRIEYLGFVYCKALKGLRLAHNSMCYNGPVFDVFINLRSLSIDGCYSGEIFKKQQKLQHILLYPDGEINCNGFHYLQQLKYIEIDGTASFKNETFKDLVNLRVEQLCIHRSTIHLESGAFTSLPYIMELSIINTHPGLQNILESLYGLAGKNMTRLEINRVAWNREFSNENEIEDRILRKFSVRYLLQICVKELILTNNNILYIDLSDMEISVLGSCLTYLDISRNKISHITANVLFQIQLVANLKYLNVSDQDRTPNRFTSSACSYKESADKTEEVKLNSAFQTGLFLKFPPFLQELNVSGFAKSIGVFPQVTFQNGTSLLRFDFAYNGLSRMGGFEGLDNLEYLDLSGNIELRVSDTFFNSLSSLETLKLNDGSLPQTVVDLQAKRFLKSLPNLTSLYISDNRLIELPQTLFESNPHLEYLDLSRNVFISVPFNLLLTPRLEGLDMSFNSLGTLDSQTRNKLDAHINLFENTFDLNLHGNFFSCSCENFPFLLWLNETYLFHAENNNFTCLSQTGHVTYVGRKNNLQFWRQCTGKVSLYASVITFTLLVCSVLLGLLVSTNKTKLIHIAITALRYQIPTAKREYFRRDVYISYAEADYQWVCHELCPALEERNLTLYIWVRDSVPGDSIPDQIAENIPQCWKTILYFTDNYEKDSWSYMSMMAAINCVDSRNPERLILLLPEDRYPRISGSLLEVVPESCIIHVATDVRRNAAIFDELCKVINKNK